MKSKKVAIIGTTLLLALSVSACGKENEEKNVAENKTKVEASSSEKQGNYPVTIKTYNYNKEPIEVTFEKAPTNVLAVYQNSIETMLALGLEDNIKAAAGLDHDVKDEWKDEFSKVKYLEEFTPSKEDAMMGQYDMILGWNSLFSPKNLGDVDYWIGKGTNTYMSQNSGVASDNTIKNETTDILNIGKIFDVEEKAQVLVDEIDNEVKKVSDSVKDKKQQTTLIIEFNGDSITAYGKNSLGGDMVTKLGAKLLVDKTTKISKEDIVKLNPDSIFVVYMDRGNEKVITDSENLVMKDKAFTNLNAVKNKRVYTIPLGEMYSSGVRTIDGINTFASGLYPDLKKGE